MKNTAKYKTSDGFQFYNEQDAKNHAKTLDDRKLTPVEEKPLKSVQKITVDKVANMESSKEKEDYRQVLKKVHLAESLEELIPFETDERKSIVDAVALRKEELILEGNETEGSEDTSEDNS